MLIIRLTNHLKSPDLGLTILDRLISQFLSVLIMTAKKNKNVFFSFIIASNMVTTWHPRSCLCRPLIAQNWSSLMFCIISNVAT